MNRARLPSQRDLFAIPQEVCYLNTAYMSPLLESVREAGEAGLAAKSQPWTITADHWFGRVERARELFARLIAATGDDVALVPSASYGVGTAAANVPLGRGDRVVLIADQFPSGVYPWRARAAECEAELVQVPRPRDLDWTSAILSAIDERCAVACLPAVHWTDGGAIGLERIAARLREVDAQLVLDLSQSLGAAEFDVGAVDPDWLCAPTYKWLLGPYSAGFLYVAPRRQQGRPLEEGWIVRAGSDDFSRLVDYVDDYREGARRFDVGERSNFILVPMVVRALEQILEWSVAGIANTLDQVTASLAEIAGRHGLVSIPRERRGPHLLGLEAPGGLPADLIPRLAEDHVYVGRRGDSLRVAPHLHVTERDLDAFDRALRRTLG
ncbi:MAG: aminotransferase class V-fold PLP-dependent enzyme [Myxococcota bacterium]